MSHLRKLLLLAVALGTLGSTAIVVAQVGDLEDTVPVTQDSAVEDTVPVTQDSAVDDAVPVTVRREKPDRLKKPTLRFLQENLDFLRAQIDGLHWEADRHDADGSVVDPTWMHYLELQQAAERSVSDVERIGEESRQRELLESVAELVAVEESLQRLSNALDGHEERLQELHEDYVEDHVTSLVVLLQGTVDPGIQSATLTREDGRVVDVSFDGAIAGSLESGAIVELDHDFVEPRWQWLELSFGGAASIEPVYLEIEPLRDQLNFVQIDLGSVRATSPAEEWSVTSWSRPLSGGYDWTW